MAFNYNTKEFIKVYRKLMEWEWYTDVNTKTLFIHCLLRANWKAGTWQGIHYDAGEFITSLPSLSEETGLTPRQVRTSLERLKSTGEIESRMSDNVSGKKLTKCRIITVKNWGSYQVDDRQTVRQTTGNRAGKRQANDRQTTADIRNIEYIEYKEKKNNTHIATSQLQCVCQKWNSLGLKKNVLNLTPKREAKIKSLIEKYGEECLYRTMDMITQSDFLSKGSDTGWNITFDWFITHENFVKVMEGQYGSRDVGTKSEVDSEWQ